MYRLLKAAIPMGAGIALACAGSGFAQNNAAAPAFSDEVSKQAGIYQSRGEKVPGGYVTDRSLLAYAAALPPGFRQTLADLGPKDRWLDIGAGRGQAVLDYYTPRYDAMHREGQERRGKKAQSVAMSIEDRRNALWHQTAEKLEAEQIRYLSGRRLREYSAAELGKFALITDVFGGFSYTQYLSLFMEKVLAALEVNGSFYTTLIDVYPENAANRPLKRDTPFLTEIVNADGSRAGICAWLKSISCIAVSCELKSEWEAPIEAYQVRKVCDKATVPALTITHFAAGTPPERRFQAQQMLTGSPAPRNAAR
ncbi:MAG: hypothetical protein K2X06_14945 [Burkholderiales bacterium]|nr:hypothetical protein [Burkholderiales bacterium]